ncbi:hypothetical protein BD769DRAFT_1380637 [Suillus cothurnatus]|nr:hypothetical protein BD769DRAFT_1380637 [Suillus cothurnatus]
MSSIGHLGVAGSNESCHGISKYLKTPPLGRQIAKRTAWCLHVEANIGDLLAIQRLTFPQTYSFYSLDDNYWKLTNPAITFMHPIPQRYYVPARIRELHRPHSFSDTQNKYGLACEQDKVSAQVKASFATLHTKLLNEQKFFFGEWPTTLDVYLASHILLLLDPPFPDQLMRRLRLVRPPSSPPTKTIESRMNEADIQFCRMRWMWFAIAYGGMACYVLRLWLNLKGQGDHCVLIYQTCPEVFIFISSTCVGGLIINLTAADTVIFYNHDWSPSNDAQAMYESCAYRLVQTRQVTVYWRLKKDMIVRMLPAPRKRESML